MKISSLLLFLLLIVMPLKALKVNEPSLVPSGEMLFWTESIGDWSEEKAIILIAGAGASAHMWPDCFCERLVNEGYFLIRYDQREVGLSTGPTKEFDVEDLGDDVITIMDAYHLPSAHVVGMSMGGMVAQFTAANHPDRVKSTTLIATAPIGGTSLLDQPLSFSELLTLTTTLHFLSSHLLPERYEGNTQLMKERYAFFNGNYPIDEELLHVYLQDMYYRTYYPAHEGDSVHQRNVEKLMQTLDERRHIFKKIEAPTLIIHGKLDTLILPSRGGIALSKVIQGSTLKIYPDMGHGFFNRDLLNSIASDILTFIDS